MSRSFEGMRRYFVVMVDDEGNDTFYTFWADDADHAVEQAKDAEPDCTIQSCTVEDAEPTYAVRLTREEWDMVMQAMYAAKRAWTADYDYAPDLAEKIEKAVYEA